MIDYDLTTVKACIFDVDGVLSKAVMSLGPDGIPCRTANVKDSYAIQHAVKTGLTVGIITGANLPCIRERYLSLGVEDIFIGAVYKIDVFKDFLLRRGLSADEVLYMGDDVPDYPVLASCGLPCCPSDAAPEVKAVCRYISPYAGGEGCVRDVIEQILQAQGQWMHNAQAFGW